MVKTTNLRAFLYTSVFLLILILIPSAAFSQSGILTGQVLDKITSEPLIGANVVIEGTSMGIATDPDGNYLIRGIPVGSYTIKISYIGYVTISKDVNIVQGETKQETFLLEPMTLTGETVTVLAQARGQNEAINQQLSARTITNVVASEKIRELPDENAAAALSRLPGLSLMEGDKVVIRGVQAKMNTVLINGIQLPSTDLDNRSTNLGFISSNLLSGIEVIKALTPDMDANAIGGVVNLKLREAPENLHFDVMTQGIYNAQDRTTDNYKVWASGSSRFFDNKLGVFIQGNADRSNVGNDEFQAVYGTQEGNLPYGQQPYQMNNLNFNDDERVITNIGGSIILDYKFDNGKIVLQNTIAHTVNDNSRYRLQMDFNLTEFVYSLFRDKHNKELLINALQAEYNIGDIKAEFSLSHSFSDKETDIRYGDPGNAFGFHNQRTGQPFQDLNGNPIGLQFRRPFLTPDSIFQSVRINPTDYLNADIYGWSVTREETFKQHLYNTTLDFTIPVTFSDDFTSKFKIGGKFTRSTRNNDVDEAYRRTGEDDFYNGVQGMFTSRVLTSTDPIMFSDLKQANYERGEYFLDDTYPFLYALDPEKMDKFMMSAKSGWLKSRHKTRSERNDFEGAEIFSAGYLMGDFNIGPRLSIIAGVRYEHYNMDYNSRFVFVTHSVDGDGVIPDTLNTVNRNDDHLFPNAQLRYKFTDWLDMRFAYTNSISRPDFLAILPNVYFSPGESAAAGNTKLKPTISENFDLNFSVYNNDIGLFTVGGFYKKMENVFFQTNIYFKNLNMYDISFPDSAAWTALGMSAPTQSTQVTTYVNNNNPAYVKGIELEWQTNFWYLPKPLNALVLNVNYTRVWSEMDYRQVRNIDSSYQDGRFTRHVYLTRDTIRTARLLNQGDHILNLALGVDYKGFSGRISFNLQSNVITVVGARPETDQFTGDVYKWDLTLQQKLPIEGLSIAFNAVNIFHSPTETFQKFRRTVGGEVVENQVLQTYSPSLYSLNLRYSF